MNMFSIARRIIFQVHNDRRTLALLLVAPVIMISLLWVVMNGSATRPDLAVSGLADQLLEELRAKAQVVEVATAQAAIEEVRALRMDAAIYLSDQDGKIHVDVDGADPAITALVLRVYQLAAFQSLKDSMEQAPKALRAVIAKKMEKIQPEVTLLHGLAGGTAFDYLAPVMMGFIIFFFIFILSGISFLRERLTGTMERMLVSPAGRLDVVMGYMLGFGFYACIQTILIQVFMLYVIQVPSAGSFWGILAVNLALCLMALSLGGLVSAAARTEFQIMQFIPVVIVPQIVFSGLLDLREAPAWVQWLSGVFPLTYAGRALRQIMVRGGSLADVLPDFAVVLGFSVVFILLNALVLCRTD